MLRILLFSCLLAIAFGCTKESFAPETQIDPNQPTVLTVTLLTDSDGETANCGDEENSGVPNAEVRIYAGTTATGEVLSVLTTNQYGRSTFTADEKAAVTTHFVSATFPDGTVKERRVATPLHRQSYVTFSHR